jgi:hypothetical protein
LKLDFRRFIWKIKKIKKKVPDAGGLERSFVVIKKCVAFIFGCSWLVVKIFGTWSIIWVVLPTF